MTINTDLSVESKESGMSGYAWLMVGNMVAKVFGDHIQGTIERIPVLGPWLANSRRTVQSEKREAENTSKIYINKETHKLKLIELKTEFENDLKKVHTQFFNKQEDAKYREFLKSCFPLRNPYDIAMPFNYSFELAEEKSRVRMTTIANGHNLPIAPLRLILAMPNSTHPLAQDINSELSLFLINYFPSNGNHAVLSDIGSWRDDIPVNDASINYLYKGLHGQPTAVLVPEFMDNGGTIKFKIWSWAMGDTQPYPEGFNYGYIDVDILSRHIWCEEIKEYAATLKKTGLKDKEVSDAMVIINTVEDPSYGLSIEDKHRLLSKIIVPQEVKRYNNHSKKLRAAVSTVFSVICAMYTDTYHLKTSGVMPLLPFILDENVLPGINLYLKEIVGHYLILTDYAHREHLFSTEMAAEFELSLIESINKVGSRKTDYMDAIIQDYKYNYMQLLLNAASNDKQLQKKVTNLNKRAKEII